MILLWIIFCNFATIIIALCSMTAEGIKIQEPKRFHLKKIYLENFRTF